MIVCEFCLQYVRDSECKLGLKIPKGMSCREFGPGMDKFCANPEDFVSPNQIIQMAQYFGFKGTELKKVKVMATAEETVRSQAAALAISAVT